MDISGINGGAFQQYLAESQKQSDAVSSFQSVLDRAMKDPDAIEKKQIKEACEAFESYFLQIMFREMRKTSFNEGGFLAKSQAEKIFIDMMDEETAKQAAKTGGIGLAKMMYEQMTLNLYKKSMD
jgi:flagellar protein FlgJ